VEIDRHLIDADATVVEVTIDGAAPRADLAKAWKDAVAAQMQAGDKSDGAKVRIDFADAAWLDFVIRRDGDHYVVHRSDIGLDYLVSEAQAQALLGKAD
jgi:hypothetical protein